MSQKKTDNTTMAGVQVTYAHHEIHGGSSFALARVVTLGGAGDDELLIVTPASDKWSHFVWTVSSDDTLVVSFYEGTGLTTPTDITADIHNRNRNSDKVSGMTIGHTPVAGAGDGTLLWQGATTAFKAVSTVEDRSEWVLKTNTAYLMRAAGAAGDALTILLDWYEHTNTVPGEF